MSYYKDKMEELNADGIDFIPISESLFKKDYLQCEIIKSYTKEEFEEVKYIPKTPYLFWKIVDGKKIYCEL